MCFIDGVKGLVIQAKASVGYNADQILMMPKYELASTKIQNQRVIVAGYYISRMLHMKIENVPYDGHIQRKETINRYYDHCV